MGSRTTCLRSSFEYFSALSTSCAFGLSVYQKQRLVRSQVKINPRGTSGRAQSGTERAIAIQIHAQFTPRALVSRVLAVLAR